jgi:hypothetical protein
MNEEEAGLALKAAGFPVHRHAGVWWIQTAPLFCKPLDPLRLIAPGSARPNFRLSPLGYSHAVAESSAANQSWSIVYQHHDSLAEFGMDTLKPKRRTWVRKALRHVEVRPIKEIHAALDAMNEISISSAERTGHGLPPDHYRAQRKQWEEYRLREFSIPGREWWGAYLEGRLIAYLYAYVVGNTLTISAFKSHSEFLRFAPNDALLFTFLEYARDCLDCEHVLYGDWNEEVPTLNEFKQRFGFSKKVVPVYRRETVPFNWLRGFAKVAKYLQERASKNQAPQPADREVPSATKRPVSAEAAGE